MAVARPVNALQVGWLILLFSTFFIVALGEDDSSAFIIREPKKELKASKLIITEKPDQVTFLQDAGSIGTDEISSVIALALGFTSFKDLSWSGLLAGNLFKRPKANILITVDGIKEGDKLDTPQVASYPVKESDDVDSLEEIMSFSSLENLPSHISNMFGGKSLSLSISADYQLAFASHSTSSRSRTFYWSDKDEAFKVAGSQDAGDFSDLSLNKDEIIRSFSKTDFGSGVKFSSTDNVFAVTVDKSEKAVFDMNKKEDFILFAELQAFLQTYQTLEIQRSLVRDAFPDTLAFSVSSLKGLRRRYGDNSLQVRGALKLLSQVIPKISKEFSVLYDGKALVEVLLLDDEGTLNDRYPDETQRIYEVVEKHLDVSSLGDFHDNLPAIRLRRSLEQHVRSSLCEGLHNKLSAMRSPLQVLCEESITTNRFRRAAESTAAKPLKETDDINLSPVYSSDYPVIFNITLWLMIAIALAVYLIAIVLWYMDPGRDSIIYRMTNQRIKTE